MQADALSAEVLNLGWDLMPELSANVRAVIPIGTRSIYESHNTDACVRCNIRYI